MTQQDSYEMILTAARARLALADEVSGITDYRAIEPRGGNLTPDQQAVLQTFWGYAADPVRFSLVTQEDIALIELHAPDVDGGCKVDRYGYASVRWPCTVIRSMGHRYGVWLPDPKEASRA